jgi:hypothetical protein
VSFRHLICCCGGGFACFARWLLFDRQVLNIGHDIEHSQRHHADPRLAEADLVQGLSGVARADGADKLDV